MTDRWTPHPHRTPDPWPPVSPAGPDGPDMPGWLEERLFEQRIVMIRGQLTQAVATGVAAALLTLDAAGPDPV
jgi:ATP-dependent Clp protease, protease subunit